MELIKYYDLVIDYHPGKSNIVAEALSRRNSTLLSYIHTEYMPMLLKLRSDWVLLDNDESGTLLVILVVRPTLLDEIKIGQVEDKKFIEITKKVEGINESVQEFSIRGGGILMFKERMCVPDIGGIREKVIEEAHYSMFTMYPGTMKIYHKLKELYWWNGMKCHIAEYVAKFLVCQ